MLRSLLTLQRSIQRTGTTFVRHLNEDRVKRTFQYRIQTYFEEILKKQPEKNEALSTRIDHLMTDNKPAPRPENFNQEYHQCQVALANFKEIRDNVVIQEKLINMDYKLSNLLIHLKSHEIFRFLASLSSISRLELTAMEFYEKAIAILIQLAMSGTLNNHELVQLLYFLSLKSHNKEQIENLKPFLPDIDELCLMEKCIVAWVMQKSSIKLHLRQAKMLEKVVEEDFKSIIDDPQLFVPICKSVIISEASNSLCLQKLSDAILTSNKQTNNLNFGAVAHTLALYADALIMDSKVVDLLVKTGVKAIQNDMNTNKNMLQISDVNTFLWSLSHLGTILSLSEKLIVRSFVEHRWTEYTSKDNLGMLVDSMLSLNMLRCWSTKLLKICLSENLFAPVIRRSYHWKIQTKLQLLIAQISLEMKMRVPKSLVKPLKVGYKISDRLEIVKSVANKLVARGLISQMIIECPVKAIVIPGVTLITEKEIYHIDVLDNSTCLKNTFMPHGLMNLKLRLLSRLRLRQIMIKADVFNSDSQMVEKDIEDIIMLNIKHGSALNVKHLISFEV
ncbi:hypothetical protein TKK_0012640 [Trichogramma kaykai]|uniref:Uncharacterized protein n=1 Tax=Trichogramma kaykai TaxID=54128 RepID=A0ABD2WM57_9HYME